MITLNQQKPFLKSILDPNQRRIEPDHYCLHSVQRYSNLITSNEASCLLLSYLTKQFSTPVECNQRLLEHSAFQVDSTRLRWKSKQI